MRVLLCLVFVVVGALSCSDEVTDLSSDYNEENDLIKTGGKYDTGYYSSLAAELEGTYSSRLQLDVTDLSESERQAYLVESVSDTNKLQTIAQEQVRLSKRQLGDKLLHLNLTKGDMVMGDIALVNLEERVLLQAEFSVNVELLVTVKELVDTNTTMDELVGTTHKITVAGDPRELLYRAEETCASGHTAGHLYDSNYFYYFDPTAESCSLPMIEATFVVNRLLATAETYPEYDRLTEDGKVELGIIFGAAETVPYDGDWGVMMWRTYHTNLRLAGYDEVIRERGRVYTRTIDGLTEEIELYSPYDLHELGTHSVSELLVQLLQSKEIIAYNGHSFYGSLDVLQHRENYPEDRYQILFMNSCWSYEYYTKQVFANKATEQDPTGWLDVDVVNNTQPAYFTHMEGSTRKLVTNLMAGARSGGADDQGRRYSWQNIIGILNDESRGVCPEDADPMDCRHYQETNRHEIYGVSGSTTNLYLP